MIRAGEMLTFVAAGRKPSWWPIDADGVSTLKADLARTLSTAFRVHTIDIASSGAVDLFNWSYVATIVVTLRESYAHVNDASSVVANAVWQATGELPSVSAPDYGQPTPAAPAGVLEPIRDALTGVVTGVRSEVNFVLVLVVGGILVLGYLLVSGRNVGAIAKAVRS
jgi:hypothetical protein